ncbi:MAG: tetratricopeptide repeat protein [Bacillota bacterium]
MADSLQRMQKLQEMLQRQPDDLFLLYALAMEHRKVGNLAEALQYLTRVMEKEPGYCAAYQQAGQIHEQAGNVESARQAYVAGIAAADRAGDRHAKQEMEEALHVIS